MFLGLLFRFMKSKFEIFFYSFSKKWIKHIDLFQTMDKGEKNICSL